VVKKKVRDHSPDLSLNLTEDIKLDHLSMNFSRKMGGGFNKNIESSVDNSILSIKNFGGAKQSQLSS